jgi:nucleotide-binding universal stress UspA family protein
MTEPMEERKSMEKNLYRKILVPVDFTEYSFNACRFAVALAGKLNSEIELMHAYYTPELSTLPYDESFSFQGTLAEYLNENKEKAKADLDLFTGKIKEYIQQQSFPDIHLTSSLLRGMPVEAALYMVENSLPDAIVMGTHSIDKRKELSSYMVRIIQEVKVPVLVIPEDSSITNMSQVKLVAYATDFDLSDFEAIQKLAALVAPFGSRIICIHVGITKLTDEEDKKMRELKEHFLDTHKDLPVECAMVEQEDVIEGLDQMIKEKNIDMLALTTHRRNLITRIIHPSVTRKMYFHTNIPLLIFHC